MFGDGGYTTLFKIRGMPVRLHWSFLAGMLVFGGLRFAPGIWLGYFILIAAHELGHGFLAQRFGCRIRSLDVHGFGGLCSYSGRPTELQGSVIAWGGVLAQLLIFLGTQLLLRSLGPPTTGFWIDAAYVFTRVNLLIAALNLIPLSGFDGARAWRLPALWWRSRQQPSKAKAQDELAAGFRKKLQQRERGPYAPRSDDEAP